MERLKLDSYLKERATDRLQLNIYYTLEDILEELKKLNSKGEPKELSDKTEFEMEHVSYYCECGKMFESEKQLRGHKIKCKGSG